MATEDKVPHDPQDLAVHAAGQPQPHRGDRDDEDKVRRFLEALWRVLYRSFWRGTRRAARTALLWTWREFRSGLHHFWAILIGTVIGAIAVSIYPEILDRVPIPMLHGSSHGESGFRTNAPGSPEHGDGAAEARALPQHEDVVTITVPIVFEVQSACMVRDEVIVLCTRDVVLISGDIPPTQYDMLANELVGCCIGDTHMRLLGKSIDAVLVAHPTVLAEVN